MLTLSNYFFYDSAKISLNRKKYFIDESKKVFFDKILHWIKTLIWTYYMRYNNTHFRRHSFETLILLEVT